MGARVRAEGEAFLFFLFFFKFNPAGLTFGFWYREGPGEETATPVKADAFFIPGICGRWLNQGTCRPEFQAQSLLWFPDLNTTQAFTCSIRAQK